MKEAIIGAHILENGLEFFGIDEVNALIEQGHVVTKVEASDVLVEEVPGEPDDEEQSYALLGFKVKIILSDA